MRDSGNEFTKSPCISVVIPARNRATSIGRAIKSAQMQIPAPDEIIVIDNGSEDATAHISESLGAHVIRGPSTWSIGECRNVGLRQAASTWTAFLDSDDEWLPGHLARMCRHVDQFLLISESAVMTPTKTDAPRILGSVDHHDVVLQHPFDVVEPENRIVTSACMVNTRLALDVGGFANSSYCEDLDLWIRCVESSPAIALGTVGTVYYRHGEQVSAHMQRMRDAAQQSLRSHGNADWYSASAFHRLETRHAWDEFRQSIRNAQYGESAHALGKLLRRPQDAVALLRLFRSRKKARKRGLTEWQRALATQHRVFADSLEAG